MIEPVKPTNPTKIKPVTGPVSVYRVVLALGRDSIWTSKAFYTLDLARGYVRGIRTQLRTPKGIQQLSNQISKPLTLGLDYSVGVIERVIKS